VFCAASYERRRWEEGSPPPNPDSSLTGIDAPISIEIEPEVRTFVVLSGPRDRDGHEANRALTGLRAFCAGAPVERQPKPRPESESDDRRRDQKHSAQPARTLSLAAFAFVRARLKGLSHGR
jgi:hypothetical protein